MIGNVNSIDPIDWKNGIERASQQIASLVRRTECHRSQELSRRIGAEVWLKLENLQESGSFKLRGVANKIASLSSRASRKPLVAASTGNHGAAFAYALRALGREGKLFLPRTASATKLRSIAACGVAYDLVGDDCVEAEMHARSYAREHDADYVSPYNDPDVVAGQGTIAIELLGQMEAVDTVFAPVGGGGLIAGIGAYLKTVHPAIEVIGCQPVRSSVMFDSIRAGRIVEVESLPTLSDATAGGLEPGTITFDLCRRYVDNFALIDEDEIADAIRFVNRHQGMVVEGAAALPVAAALRQREQLAGRRIALILTGSKIDPDVLQKVLARA